MGQTWPKPSPKNFRDRLAVWIGTALGAGYFPKAPGTAGSLVGLLLAYHTVDWSFCFRVILLIGLLILGIWSGAIFDASFKIKDHQMIVIDEVVGMGISVLSISTATVGFMPWVIAFLLFRFFDIVKLPPVRQIDLWSKKTHPANQLGRLFLGLSASNWISGLGVMLDDVLAGFQGLFIIFTLQWFDFFL